MHGLPVSLAPSYPTASPLTPSLDAVCSPATCFLLRFLLEQGAEVDPLGGELNASPLHWATRQGHLEMVTLLVNAGANPRIQDNQGFNTLHIAAQFGHAYDCALLNP